MNVQNQTANRNPLTCFPPVSSGNEIILILGSFPGELSLTHQQYYAHPRNAFWPILGDLLGFDPNISYGHRLEMLRKYRIALWDVLSSCRRKGSLDMSIEKESMLINDFTSFFEQHDSITHVMFNGQRAEAEFKRNVLPLEAILTRKFEFRRLPSSSPAMATLNLEQKTAAWQCIGDICLHNNRGEIHKKKEPTEKQPALCLSKKMRQS